MGCAETITSNIVEVVTFEFITRGKGNRVNNDIQRVPVVIQLGEDIFDLLITADITGNNDVGVELGCHLGNPILQLVILEGKGEFSPFAVHGLRDTPGDRSVTGETNNKRTFTL